jgi:hypothetical protein
VRHIPCGASSAGLHWSSMHNVDSTFNSTVQSAHICGSLQAVQKSHMHAMPMTIVQCREHRYAAICRLCRTPDFESPACMPCRV